MSDATTHALPDGVQEVGGRRYMPDARGALVPVEMVNPRDKLMDETVRKVMAFAISLSEQIARFKGHTFSDLNSLQSLFEQEFGSKAGGAKGNVSYTSFDGLLKVQVQIADRLFFGPELQEAKKLVDECLLEWGAESRPELQAVVNRAFNVEREGQINRAELFSLLRLDIEDERWNRAMEAIRASIRVMGSKAYVRFYQRPDAGAPWKAITIDLAAA